MIVLGRFNLLHEMCLKYPNTLKLWLGPTMLWVLVNEPRYIQKILLSPICLEKPFFYKFLRLDSGLISSKCKFFWCELSKPVFDFFLFLFPNSDDVWKIHRKSLNYSFNLKILQTFIPTFIENAKKLVESLSVNIEKIEEFDMLYYTSKSALNMICGELKNLFVELKAN